MLKRNLVMILIIPQLALAFSWRDLWFNSNQQGSQLLKQNKNADAAKVFTDNNWKGAAYYKNKQYSEAYAEFKHDNSAQGLYNQGNALANMQKYQEAIDAYTKAEQLEKNFPDAKYNRSVVEQLLKQQQEQADKNQPSDQQNQKNSDKKQGNDDQQQNTADQNKSNTDKQKKDAEQQQANSNKQNADKSDSPQNTSTPGKSGQSDSKQLPQNNSDQTNNAQNDMKNKTQDGAQNQQRDNGKSNQQDSKNQQNSSAKTNTSNNNNTKQQAQSANDNALTQNTQLNNANQNSNNTQNAQQIYQEQQVKSALSQVPDDPGGLLRNKFLRDYEKQQQDSGNE